MHFSQVALIVSNSLEKKNCAKLPTGVQEHTIKNVKFLMEILTAPSLNLKGRTAA